MKIIKLGMAQIMTSLADAAKLTATKLAENKEKAIKAVLDDYFDGPWTEEQASTVAGMNVYTSDGREEFLINDKVVLKISPIKSHVDIEGFEVKCTYTQIIEVIDDGS